MDTEQDYAAANLPQNLVNDLQHFEDKLSNEAHKEVILIAYEKEKYNK